MQTFAPDIVSIKNPSSGRIRAQVYWQKTILEADKIEPDKTQIILAQPSEIKVSA